MKLYYHNDFNFGDALNPLLFQKLLPDFFDQEEREVFLGIGTVIGWRELLEQTKKAYVFSSGYGYGPVPALDPRWEFLCVRGPLTAKALNLDLNLAVSDGGILSDILVDRAHDKKYRYSYMPHHYSEEKYFEWGKICHDAGIHFISPAISENNSVQSVLNEVASSEVLICEALHGAIIADALRVPWIPVKAYGHINDFKWRDYAAAMELSIEFGKIPSIFSEAFLKEKFASKIPVQLPSPAFGIIHRLGNAYMNHSRERIIQAMKSIVSQGRSYLASDRVLEDRQSKLMDILRKFETSRHSS